MMKKVLYIVSLIALMVNACTEDIIHSDPEYDKVLLEKQLSSVDSLDNLIINPLDMGKVKIRAAITDYASIQNTSSTMTMTIYSLEPTDTRGIFQYSYPEGMPFDIKPGEDTRTTGKIMVKFIASPYNTGYYYDTLIVNNHRDYYIPLKVRIFY